MDLLSLFHNPETEFFDYVSIFNSYSIPFKITSPFPCPFNPPPLISMIPPTILIPFSLFALLSLFSSLPFSFSISSHLHLKPTMPISSNSKRNLSSSPMAPFTSPNNKLRRLPHVFSKVLQLPFDSDADVSIEDRPDCLRFVAKEGDSATLGGNVRVHVLEVLQGITKVVIGRKENRSQPSMDDLELNVWRFRLPATARPELAKAVYVDGQLVVTVPKKGQGLGQNKMMRGENCKRKLKGNMGNLLVAQ